MKNSIKLFLICSVAALVFALLFSSYALSQQKQFTNPFIKNQEHTLKTRDLPYHQGMITIKLKEGVGEFSKQTGVISFNISSLDILVDKYEVNFLEKRFNYNPNMLKKGLPDLSRIYRISFPEKNNVYIVAEAFNKNPNIEYAEPVPIDKPADEPDDILYDLCQHLPQIFAPEAWEIHHGEDGPEIVIAIIDNGVYWKHIDLTENIWNNLGEDFDGDGKTLEFIGDEWVFDPDDINNIDDDGNGFIDDFIGWDIVDDNNDPDHNSGEDHGTHCSGIAGGVTDNGEGIASVSWNVKTMPVQVAAPTGWFVGAYDGIIYAAENGADFISNSWGGTLYSAANQDVINYATGLGSIMIASAGNLDGIVDHYPSDYSNVVSVSSVSVDDTKAGYSSFGPATDISAPGGGWEGGILSTAPYNTYQLMSGTSMACPLTAGCFGLLKSYNPGWTNEQLITQLMGTADNIDDLNPVYQYLLGTGRVNAFRMLTEENVTMPQELKLSLFEADPQDQNGNNIIEPGEEVTLNFEFRNHVPYIGEDNVTVSIQSDDPEITVLDGTAVINIPPDGLFTIEDQFLIQVSAEASSHFADITIHFDTNLPIVYGQDINFRLLVAPSGIFVYDGNDLQTDLSGWFIKELAADLGITQNYLTTPYSGSLDAFDAVFMSFGNYGGNYIPFESDLAVAAYNYLVNGGSLYIEGGDALGFDQASNDILLTCLGIASASDGSSAEKPITHLEGQIGTLTEGMLFTQSLQSSNTFIDIYNPLNNHDVAFIESTVGNVGIQHTGIYGQKTFCSSYTLAALADHDELSNRNQLYMNIFEFFGLTIEEGYLSANFGSDTLYGLPSLEVQFNEQSFCDPNYPVNSWEWDFDNDGEIDSYDEEPVWTYDESGCFSVKLVVSNGIKTDTVLKENYIDTKAVPFGTWYLSESPYMIYHDITVSDGLTLTIEPGVEVIFTGHYKFNVLGQLLAEGTESDSIYFTSQDIETGWFGLRLTAIPSTNDTSKLDYCIIEYGRATGFNEPLDNMGGGIFIWEADAVITNSVIRNNSASGSGLYSAVGGGIVIGYSDAVIRNCTILRNEAEFGGGISIAWCDPLIENCLISDNILTPNSGYQRESGGIYIYDANSSIINNTIVNNSGGGIDIRLSDPVLVNTIIWGNNDGSYTHNLYIDDSQSHPEITYCDLQGGFDAIAGNGSGGNFTGVYENNIDADPLFVDPGNGDYHLTENSPCIDAGDPAYPLDPDGTISDIGAFYFDQPIGIFDGSIVTGNFQVFPNPVISYATLHFTLKNTTEVEINIIDLKGKLISVVLNKNMQKGKHSVVLNEFAILPGVYFCVLKTKEGIQTKKIVKL